MNRGLIVGGGIFPKYTSFKGGFPIVERWSKMSQNLLTSFMDAPHKQRHQSFKRSMHSQLKMMADQQFFTCCIVVAFKPWRLYADLIRTRCPGVGNYHTVNLFVENWWISDANYNQNKISQGPFIKDVINFLRFLIPLPFVIIFTN